MGYGYTPSWEASEITDWFSAIDGFMKCDGYAGYSERGWPLRRLSELTPHGWASQQSR